uniref:Ycf21 n=1 Tax=Dipterocladia arabiensis TaxID=2007176 RepID=A0A1Z1M0E0_9FLOR|nr:hypothetical protein [Dipterocladia arabiensis]ARW59330.1 hypothetical protein [Dipterocladia arabiensis]
MTVYIYTFYKFHNIFIVPKTKILSLNIKSCTFIPIPWQLILTNDGSFTQIVNYLDNKSVKLRMLQKYNQTSKQIHRNLRCIWLENSIYTKLIFARSIWLFKYIDKTDYNIKGNQPIGNSLINSQIDIYKNIHEIYYGYSQEFENKFNQKYPLWGRKYTLYYKNKSYITIQEYFSPQIINLFISKSN